MLNVNKGRTICLGSPFDCAKGLKPWIILCPPVKNVFLSTNRGPGVDCFRLCPAVTSTVSSGGKGLCAVVTLMNVSPLCQTVEQFFTRCFCFWHILSANGMNQTDGWCIVKADFVAFGLIVGCFRAKVWWGLLCGSCWGTIPFCISSWLLENPSTYLAFKKSWGMWKAETYNLGFRKRNRVKHGSDVQLLKSSILLNGALETAPARQVRVFGFPWTLLSIRIKQTLNEFSSSGLGVSFFNCFCFTLGFYMALCQCRK